MKRSVKICMAMIAGLVAVTGVIIFFVDLQPGGSLCINEVMAGSSTAIVEGKEGHGEWIELYNGTKDSISLEGYGLSDNPDEPYKYRFSDVTIKSGDFLLIYTGEEFDDRALYTGFGLKQSGETVLLTSEDGEVLDQVTYSQSYSDHSYGRKPDGKRFALLSKATPGSSNTSTVSRYVNSKEYAAAVKFSTESGYYDEEFDLVLTAGEEETIFYTLDGSEPGMTSPIYKEPIHIYDRSDEPNLYAGIRTTEVDMFSNSVGREPVDKAMVIRARAEKDGRLSKTVTTKTYFPGVSPSLMTVSLVTDPENLFDRKKGIYIPGDTYHYYTKTAKTSLNMYNLGNYSERGKDAERPVSVCFINPDGSFLASQEAGLRVSAGLMNTSLTPVKSLRLYGSYKYDAVNLFPSEIFGPDEEKLHHRVLVLRTHVDFINNSMTDVYIHRLVENEKLGGAADRPVIVYLDGEYWGLAYMREWLDENYVSDRYGLAEENIAMVKYATVGNMQLKYGRQQDLTDFLNLTEFAQTHDLSMEENFNYIADRLDMDNYIKTYLVRIFFASTDWPDNNMRYFRAIEPDGSIFGDGKWRSILFDMDYGCVDYHYNMLALAMGEITRTDSMGITRPATGSTELFTSLMENRGFREKFLDLYEDYKNTVFSKDYMEKILDQVVAEIEPELPRNEKRWTKEKNWRGKLMEFLGVGQDEAWDLAVDPEASIEVIREFIQNRETYMDEQMEALYERYEDRPTGLPS